MSNLSLWVVNKKRFEFVVDTIEGVTLNLIALTDDLTQSVKMNKKADDMVLACADYGVSDEGNRFCDDDKLADYLGEAWLSPEFTIDCDPSLKFQVGERVAELSGILDFIKDQRETEELEALQAEEDAKDNEDNEGELDESGNIKIGVHSVPSDTDLGNMSTEQMAQHHKDNA